MLKACTIGQKVFGFFTLAVAAAFGLAWLNAVLDQGPMFTIGSQNCIELDSYAVTWGELHTRSVADPSGHYGIEFWTVPLRTIPNWSIALGLSLISVCLLLITPQNIATDRCASERGLLGRFMAKTSIRQP